MAYAVDFKDVATTPILDVAKMLGITNLIEAQAKIGTETVTQFHGRCPISKSKNSTAFKITPKINRFVCFCDSCKKLEKRGGDCIELVCRVRGVDRMDAAKEIRGADKAADNARPQQEVADERKPTGFDPLKFLSDLDPAHDELAELGISPETFKVFKAGYCKRGPNRGRLAVAIVDSQGGFKDFVSTPIRERGDLLFPKDYVVPYFMGCHLVEEGPLHLFNNILDAIDAYENGERSILILLRPITADTLTSLTALMKDRKSTSLEICY